MEPSKKSEPGHHDVIATQIMRITLSTLHSLASLMIILLLIIVIIMTQQTTTTTSLLTNNNAAKESLAMPIVVPSRRETDKL